MTKDELLNRLQERYRQWEGLLEEIGRGRMDRPGVNGAWEMKDIVAHLTEWHRRMVANLQAAQRGEAEPPPPWPAHLESEDEINGWIYESNRGRPVDEVLDESRQMFRDLFAVIEAMPEDVRLEQVHQGGHVFDLVWMGEEYLLPGEFFDHFRDDHEPDVRAWLARVE